MIMHNELKKYRALGVITGSLIFNLVESLSFAQNGVTFNLKPMSIGEWICDIISTLVFCFGVMMAAYDIQKHKPKKITTYKVVNDDVIEIKVEE